MAFDMFDLILVLVGLGSLLWLYGYWEKSFFSRRGVKSVPYTIPFIGHMEDVVTRKVHFKDVVQKSYNAFPDQNYIGLKILTSPMVMLTDIELIKQLYIKDFNSFQDRFFALTEESDVLFGKSIFSLTGQKWRDMRATLSPAFTSSKMRGMFGLIEECAEEMTSYLLDEAKKTSTGVAEVEVKDVFTRYANDVIASTALGFKVNSHRDRDNEFYHMGQQTIDNSGIRFFKLFAMVAVPKLFQFFRISIVHPKMTSFFTKLIADTLKIRTEQKIDRPDVFKLLMEAKKGSLKHDDNIDDIKESGFATVQESALGKEINKRVWSDSEITAQAMVFFFAGFDTSSALLSFLGYELTANPDIQKKLQEEIDELSKKRGGQIKYNDLHDMKYLDMVVSETLRHWPPVAITDRKCVKAYEIPPPCASSNQYYSIKVNEAIVIPIHAIHHDPKYWENPDKFDPERFSDENKKNIKPFTYIPFGVGPRNCIASRFALMEVKAVIFHLLQKLDMVKVPRTVIPMKLDKSGFSLNPENGFWMGFKPRQMK